GARTPRRDGRRAWNEPRLVRDGQGGGGQGGGVELGRHGADEGWALPSAQGCAELQGSSAQFLPCPPPARRASGASAPVAQLAVPLPGEPAPESQLPTRMSP